VGHVPRTTQSERVYSALRADILAGRLRPGDKLPFADICPRYSTSTGVLREGLSRLAVQGLVVNEPQLGFRVTPLSMEDLRQLTEARLFVEVRAIELAVEAGGVEWESRLVAAHHTLERTPQTVSDDPQRLSEGWVLAHARFHAVALDACPNRRLQDIAADLRASAELYRRWSVPLGKQKRDVPGEHRRILDAILAGDPQAAGVALSDHIAYTSALLDGADVPERSAAALSRSPVAG